MNPDLTNTQNIQEAPQIMSDGKSRIKCSKFNAKSGKPIKLTNDERRALLMQFNPRKRLKSSWFTIAAGVCGMAFGAFLALFMSMGQLTSPGIFPLIMAIPGLCVAIYGIYGVATAPNMEKCDLNAYEFTVNKIYISQTIPSRNIPRTIIYHVPSLSAADLINYSPTEENNTKPRIILCFGGCQVMLRNAESYAAVRNGITEGDKIRCAVLISGKYCYLSIY